MPLPTEHSHSRRDPSRVDTFILERHHSGLCNLRFTRRLVNFYCTVAMRLSGTSMRVKVRRLARTRRLVQSVGLVLGFSLLLLLVLHPVTHDHHGGDSESTCAVCSAARMAALYKPITVLAAALIVILIQERLPLFNDDRPAPSFAWLRISPRSPPIHR